MRLIAAAIVLAALIVVVGLRPRQETPIEPSEEARPEVVWEDAEPSCPHCRTDVNWYSTVCYTCFHEFVWVPAKLTCDHCVGAAELRRFKKALEDRDELRIGLRTALEGLGLPPDVVAATIPDMILYVENMKAGACAFCAGTGRWLAPATLPVLTEDDDVLTALAVERLGETCPACLGTGHCVACGGDRWVDYGDEAASRDEWKVMEAIGELDPGMVRADAEVVFRLVREFIGNHPGVAEIPEMSSLYSASQSQAAWSEYRLETVREALPEGD